MPYQLPGVDFQKIRTCRGAQHGGFEELTVSLFRVEIGKPFEIRRVEGSGGDGGVEAFVQQADGKIVGLQSKYFDELKSSRWLQIEKSIQEAKKSHPRLSKYYIAVPLDRTPTAILKWKTVELKWKGKVKLLWWGNSELIHLLSQSIHHGRLQYWFGTPQFEGSWLNRLNEVAINDLDTRYTPKHHIQTESEILLDAVAITGSFIGKFNKRLSALTEIARPLSIDSRTRVLDPIIEPAREQLAKEIFSYLPLLSQGSPLPRMTEIIEVCNFLTKSLRNVWNAFAEFDRANPTPPKTYDWEPTKEAFSSERELVRRFARRIEELEGFAVRFACADYQLVLVLGPAGAGKSHLLANIVEMAQQIGQPALMLLGEYFLSSDEPWQQLVTRLGWTGTTEEFLAAMNYEAEVAQRPALLCIDALNESSERRLWKSHLLEFAQRLQKYSNVRLLVSCREDFAELTLPPRLFEHRDPLWAVIHQKGFGENVFEAVVSYFNGYRVRANHFPPMLPEFQNPLFLKTFCEAFEDSSLPDGPITLSTVMEARTRKVCTKLLNDIDCPEDTTREAILVLAEMIGHAGGQAVSRSSARRAVESLLPGRGESDSLYRHLCSNGLIVEISHYSFEGTPQIAVRFPFERFSEYFIADRMLRHHATFDSLQTSWTADGTLNRLQQSGVYGVLRGTAKALAIMVPERFGREFLSLFPGDTLPAIWLTDFLDSLSWRSTQTLGQESFDLMGLAARTNPAEYLSALITIATIPNHRYNADFLHAWLIGMKLPVRELTWTVHVSEPHGAPPFPAVDMVIRWAFRVPFGLISDEQATLVGKVLLWLCASNRRALRLRATLAAIKVLSGRARVAASLLDDFKLVNDPYVIERMYAMAAGVAMREPSTASLSFLARNVYSHLFAGGIVLPNIMTRDFGRTVIEIANYRKALSSDINIKDCRPPYRSNWPTIWSERRVRTIETKDGWYAIKHSVQPQGCGGMYGDFGRYEMESAVHSFSSILLSNPSPVSRDARTFDAVTARRYVIQRIAELGWTPERFGEYEKGYGLRGGRQRVDIERTRLERISKKYQWIALHELLGYLSDHYKLASDWRNEANAFEGPWQCHGREFDPSQPLHDLSAQGEVTEDETAVPNPWWKGAYPDPFQDATLCSDPNAWVRCPPKDFRPLIEWQNPGNALGAYIVVGGFYSWDEPSSIGDLQPRKGELKQWCHIRTWLVRAKDFSSTLKSVQQTQFWGHGCHLIETHRKWLGTYPWGDEFKEDIEYCSAPDEWVRNDRLPLEQALMRWGEDDLTGLLPSPRFLDILGAHWAGRDFEFKNAAGTLVGFAPFESRSQEMSPLFIEKQTLISSLNDAKWKLIWAVVGDRSCFERGGSSAVSDAEVHFSAVYWLDKDVLMGGLTKTDVSIFPRHKQTHEPRAAIIEKILAARRESSE